ncbi:MAG: hypothetical protein K0S09_2067 [Sphingobacteriaceae bacterium]|jgi:hypothetical protein|nr:hypothetical protein [Sphingobacteriaceae bacterium]
MEKVVNIIHQSDQDLADMLFWLGKTPAERLAEVTRLRVNYYTWRDKVYPKSIEKVVFKRPL